MGVIYKITNPKGKVYIGKTYDLRKRINCHKCAAKKGTNIILHNSIKKHGWDNHLLQVIEEVEDSLLNEREIFWITTLKTYCYENKMGLNMTVGGDGQRSTWMHNLERRKMMSERFSGDKNPMYGKVHSKELLKQIAESLSKRAKKLGTNVPKWGVEKGNTISRKSIIAYNSKGKFLREFISLNEAAKTLNINRKGITGVLTGRNTHTCGYIFKYKTENYPFKIKVNLKYKTVKRVVLLLNKMRDIINEFEGVKEASECLGIPRGCISRAAKDYNYKPLRTGHIFKYKDEHILN